jgi:chromosome partitioning protein
MSEVLAIAHHAGGVGKTTTTLNLGYALAEAGRRVLLVDLDPQGDLSERLGIEPVVMNTLADALLEGNALDTEPTAHGFALVPSDLDSMAGIELKLSPVMERERRLAQVLERVQPAYDYILLDCPPNLTLLTANAFYAADWVLVPVEAQPKAYRQLGNLLGMIRQVQGYRRGKPGILGFVLTKTTATNATRDVETAMAADFPDLLLPVQIPQRTRLTEDSSYQGPVGWYAPTNGAALAYTALAQEVIRRVE